MTRVELDQIRKKIADYRNWFDTCTKTLAPDWFDSAVAASEGMDEVVALLDAELAKPEATPAGPWEPAE